jgi:predicted kinase
MTQLIAMKGHPATGKSTLAQALAQSLKWPLLDKDDIKDHTLGLPADNHLAYAILWQMVATQLRLGVSLIVDSPFAYPAMYAQAQALTAAHGARLLVVETNLDEILWRQRLAERSPTASTHKIQGWARMAAQLATYNECWRYPIDPAHHLLVNTAEPLETLLHQVRQRLAL